MKVLHLSAANESTGAGKATLLTHNELIRQGIQSKILFLRSEYIATDVHTYHKLNVISKFIRCISTFIDQIPLQLYPNKTHSIFSPGLYGITLKDNKYIKWADIIHIQWANHGFINLKDISSWNKPIVWTLRDMWAFTGGCHYTFDCENYKFKCGSCPELGSICEKDLSRFVFKRKMKYIPPLNINWIAISSWIKSKACESALLKDKHIDVIHSGVDASVFKLSKKETRTKLKLPLNVPIILLGAGNIREKYKGFEFAKDVLNKINKDYIVITFGAGSFRTREIPQQNIHFGELNYVQLCELYNAADVFLGPSIAEAMGKTFLEAQLCGLPVVCFNETGPVDIVKHLETGYLAKYKDSDDLLRGLEFCLFTKFDQNKIRSRAIELFDIFQVVKKYIVIYEKCIVDWSDSTVK